MKIPFTTTTVTSTAADGTLGLMVADISICLSFLRNPFIYGRAQLALNQ